MPSYVTKQKGQEEANKIFVHEAHYQLPFRKRHQHEPRARFVFIRAIPHASHRMSWDEAYSPLYFIFSCSLRTQNVSAPCQPPAVAYRMSSPSWVWVMCLTVLLCRKPTGETPSGPFPAYRRRRGVGKVPPQLSRRWEGRRGVGSWGFENGSGHHWRDRGFISFPPLLRSPPSQTRAYL